MKNIILFLVFIGLAQGADATTVTWTDVYTGCDEDTGVIECTTRFLTPSFPFKAFNVLIVDSAFAFPEMLRSKAGLTSAYAEFEVLASKPTSGLTDIVVAILLIVKMVLKLIVFSINPVNWAFLFKDHLFGVVSGMVSFMFIFTMRFVQFYIELGLVWLGISRMTKQEYSGFHDKALITVILMLVGSIWMLARDWGTVFSGVIG